MMILHHVLEVFEVLDLNLPQFLSVNNSNYQFVDNGVTLKCLLTVVVSFYFNHRLSIERNYVLFDGLLRWVFSPLLSTYSSLMPS